MARILIAGGTGATGRRVVSSLLRRGDTVRVLTRRADKARELLGDSPLVELQEGDVRHAQTLRGIGREVDVVMCTLGTKTFFGSNGSPAVDALGMKNLSEAVAGEPRISQFILLSAFGVDRKSVFFEAFSLVFNQYFRWKAEAEGTVRDSGLPYTIVRPVQFSLSNKAPRRQARLNQADPLTLLRTVNLDLVAQTLVACVQNPDAINKTFEVCEGTDLPSIETQLESMLNDDERPLPQRSPLY